jgi:hypothetical protein
MISREKPKVEGREEEGLFQAKAVDEVDAERHREEEEEEMVVVVVVVEEEEVPLRWR